MEDNEKRLRLLELELMKPLFQELNEWKDKQNVNRKEI